jgi:hypothetical protein
MHKDTKWSIKISPYAAFLAWRWSPTMWIISWKLELLGCMAWGTHTCFSVLSLRNDIEVNSSVSCIMALTSDNSINKGYTRCWADMEKVWPYIFGWTTTWGDPASSLPYCKRGYSSSTAIISDNRPRLYGWFLWWWCDMEFCARDSASKPKFWWSSLIL